ncbi:MAG TPA: hypothetical protein VG101_01635 [Puia sp.]|jgi:hypothetical protein|nr:hypothetical protein [Puia sp.]
MRPFLLLLIVFAPYASPAQEKLPVKIPKTHIALQLPDSNWYASHETDTAKGIYFYKRNPVIDSEGRSIIPAIMVFVEDATRYDGDVITFAAAKLGQFSNRGIRIDQIMIHSTKDCPLKYKNGLLEICSYTDNNIDHRIYMIFLMDKEKHGFQIYLDMTKSIGKKYEDEFQDVIRSIKEE